MGVSDAVSGAIKTVEKLNPLGGDEQQDEQRDAQRTAEQARRGRAKLPRQRVTPTIANRRDALDSDRVRT